MLGDYFDEVVKIERLAFIAEGSEITRKQEFQTHLENVCCNIQPIEASITKDITDAFGKDLVMFCANADIVEGDRVVRKDGTIYRIVAIENFKGIPGGRLKHLEIIIRAFES